MKKMFFSFLAVAAFAAVIILPSLFKTRHQECRVVMMGTESIVTPHGVTTNRKMSFGGWRPVAEAPSIREKMTHAGIRFGIQYR